MGMVSFGVQREELAKKKSKDVKVLPGLHCSRDLDEDLFSEVTGRVVSADCASNKRGSCW